jgi:hypothetical protein
VEPILIPVVIAAVVLLLWLNYLWERRRAEALSTWCAAQGWGFDASKIRRPRYPYELFERGSSRYQRFTAKKRLQEATPGLPAAAVRMFEYHYEISNGDSSETYEFTCALVDPGVGLGCVELRPERLGDKLVQAMGFEDIDFEDPEFSRRFLVQARDRKHAYDLFDGAMMRYLCTRGDGYALETQGRELLARAKGKATPESFEAMERFLRGFLAQLPRPLVNAERTIRGLEPLLEAGNASTSSRGLAGPRST